jgi:hypothetical protein
MQREQCDHLAAFASALCDYCNADAAHRREDRRAMSGLAEEQRRSSTATERLTTSVDSLTAELRLVSQREAAQATVMASTTADLTQRTRALEAARLKSTRGGATDARVKRIAAAGRVAAAAAAAVGSVVAALWAWLQ